MRLLPSFAGSVRPSVFMVLAPPLALTQNAIVALFYHANGTPLMADAGFWLLPLRRLATMPGVTGEQAAITFAIALVVTWALASLSFRRAAWSGRGYSLVAFAIFPGIQLLIIALLAIMPRRRHELEKLPIDPNVGLADVLQGVLAGAAIVVLAVLVSALMLGAYGWGLFFMTPFMSGFTTAYITNHRAPLTLWRTSGYVAMAGALGAAALLMTALEGLLCIIVVVPLAMVTAMLGGIFGHAIAGLRHRGRRPLMSVAVLPALFALEASIPPAVPIATAEHIDIAAPPGAVWRAITSDAPIALPPGTTAYAGLAYPIQGHLLGQGVGTTRLGRFSTGIARESVTEWTPGRRLAFTVLSQPPAMEEMSPYRKVHAPHVSGYFLTGDTSFTLTALSDGRTRLTLEAAHILRVDPALYWEPLARWAIRANARRVLENGKMLAEQSAN